MALRINRRPLVFCTLAFLAGLSATPAKADPLYTVTNLGSGNITLTSPSGGTVAPDVGLTLAMSQIATVSNGQVSYSFATTPDMPLIQANGPLSTIPSSLNTDPALYNGLGVTGLLNTNGYAALVVSQFVGSEPAYSTAYAVQESSSGTLGWDQAAVIASGANNVYNGGGITIAGVNTANMALIATAFGNQQPYDGLLYNLSTHSLTDLATLPAILAGDYSKLMPLAIDNLGQILIDATQSTATGIAGDTLLLTPGASPPDPLPSPEPGSCILWAVIAGTSYFAAKRVRVTG
jgi:hypothetical protein